MKLSVILLHVVLAMSFVGFFTYSVFTGNVNLVPNAKEIKLNTLPAKLEFVLKYQTPGLFTVLLCVFYVIMRRVTTPAINPMSGNEIYVEAASKILTNTLEQYVLHLVSQLILAAYIDGPTLIKIVPLLAVFFFVGRITFIIGYPLQRAFGWWLTFGPNVAAVGYCAYKFLIQIKVLV
ncbi:hypothetical protein B4U79_11065 [Dinothrombium tinctorium]|uniref:MAPEG family protein n=1 Tax=Dinothrombium tinctorium TaxID=1965070 RepID=A0A3S3RMR0_9ACAR|nr:hypothetical protein B4U79_15262 [Dinothrombium tinctorium]RWS02069.1 hypothetical protein B4U79_11065 [Dinothrombium tinctorium]